MNNAIIGSMLLATTAATRAANLTADAPKLTDWISACSAAAATLLAIVGASLWLRHLRDRSRYNVARRLVRDALILRDTIRFLRNPFASASIRDPTQAVSRKRRTGRPVAVPERIDWRWVVADRRDRLASFDAAYRAVEAGLVEAEAMMIPVADLHEALLKFLDASSQIQGAIGTYEASNADRERGISLDDGTEKQLHAAMSVMNDQSGPGGPDEFVRGITSATDKFIAPLRRYLGVWF